jgi:fluoride ion exporter CrcB/FEX
LRLIYKLFSSPVYPDVFANMVGCVWMGLMVIHKSFFTERPALVPLYAGLTSGLAGSLTTFSGWNVFASVAVIRDNVPVSVYFLILLVSYGLSYLSLQLGKHINIFFLWLRQKLSRSSSPPQPLASLGSTAAVPENSSPESESRLFGVVRLVAYISVPAISVAFVFLALFQDSARPLYIALLLGPFGTALRFFLSVHNKRFPKFPLYTFLVNIVGSCLYGGLALTFHHITGKKTARLTGLEGNEGPVYYLIPAATFGFCGTLTTVSTFIYEVDSMSDLLPGYVYVLTSVGTAQFLLFVMNYAYFKV